MEGGPMTPGGCCGEPGLINNPRAYSLPDLGEVGRTEKGCRVGGLEFRFVGLGFRIQGFGIRF